MEKMDNEKTPIRVEDLSRKMEETIVKLEEVGAELEKEAAESEAAKKELESTWYGRLLLVICRSACCTCCVNMLGCCLYVCVGNDD